MKRSTQVRAVLALAATTVFLAKTTNAVTISYAPIKIDPSQQTVPSVPTGTNLALSSASSFSSLVLTSGIAGGTAGDTKPSGAISVLNDGAFGSESSGSTAFGASPGSVITLTLAGGYNLSSIVTTSGCGNSYSQYTTQNYAIAVQQVGSSTWTPVVMSLQTGSASGGAHNYSNFDPNNSCGGTEQWRSVQVTSTFDAGDPISNIDAIQFTLLPTPSTSDSSGNSNGHAVWYREFEVTGSPYIPSLPAWNINGSGSWNTTSNWQNATVPNAIDAEADFTSAITSEQVIYTTSNVTAGKLVFNNAASYSIVGSFHASLTLQSAASAVVDVQAGSHQINIPLIIASNTTLQVADTATLKISNPMEVMPNVAVTTSVTGTGKVVYESNVTLDAGASLSLGSPTAIPALSLATGSSLNVNSSPLVVHNASLSGLTAAANDGRLNSAAVTGDTTGRLTVAVADAVAVGVGSTFAGAKVAAGDVLVKATYFGDSNLDGKVDGSDYTRIDAGYSSAGLKTGWAYGDFNRDGLINGSDYSLIDGSFGAALATLPASAIATPASSIAGPVSVPEPTTIGLLAFGAMGLLGRRSRKN